MSKEGIEDLYISEPIMAPLANWMKLGNLLAQIKKKPALYSEEQIEEAEKEGRLVLKSMVDELNMKILFACEPNIHKLVHVDGIKPLDLIAGVLENLKLKSEEDHSGFSSSLSSSSSSSLSSSSSSLGSSSSLSPSLSSSSSSTSSEINQEVEISGSTTESSTTDS